ncbi:MAG TPA: metallophosphoesterase [Gemmatimonadaceae bacterium]|nr:metallophosphoesterase [Gemmatimonadaceae bacterium]
MTIRVLLLADSHLGFDLPVRPRVNRRRRGHDFLANYAEALKPALDGEVDLVVHGGDVFDRSRVVPSLAYQAFEPLVRIADRGVPVFIVPGNHERSTLPHLRFAKHPGVHVFDRARTYVAELNGLRLAVSGFPYERGVRARFPDVLRQTEWNKVTADARVLCVHHCVEGATVGPVNYTFTSADDVVRHRDVPLDFTAVFSGHIHRRQAITEDLARRPLATPVLYPGSIERTATAEIGETKGYMLVTIAPAQPARWEFRDLPARTMIRKDIDPAGMSDDELGAIVRQVLAESPVDAVLYLRMVTGLTDAQWRVMSSSALRAMAPPTMNVELVVPARERPRGLQ